MKNNDKYIKKDSFKVFGPQILFITVIALMVIHGLCFVFKLPFDAMLYPVMFGILTLAGLGGVFMEWFVDYIDRLIRKYKVHKYKQSKNPTIQENTFSLNDKLGNLFNQAGEACLQSCLAMVIGCGIAILIDYPKGITTKDALFGCIMIVISILFLSILKCLYYLGYKVYLNFKKQ